MAFGYYKSATLDHTQAGSGDSTDWPLTISITDADFKTVGNGGYVQNANGYDIRPYSDSGLTSALTFELVYYNATTGQLEMHVKIPTLSVTVDVVIYLAFGDSGISTDGSSTATWSNNFSLVNHFDDGSTLSVTDSSSNANNGTNNGATATAGVIDGAANFSGSTQYVSLPDNASTKPAGAFAISGWFKTSTNTLLCVFTSYDQPLATVAGISFGVDIYTTRLQKLSLILGDNSGGVPYAFYGSTSVDDGNWHYFLLVSDGSTATLLFIDGGANEGSVDFGLFQNPVYTASNSVNWGRESTTGFGAGKYFVGDQDEMRLATVARNQSWGIADYNSQKSSSTFITWGSLVPTGAGGSSIKTWDGLAVASHKTHNGLAVASRKTINGLP